MIKVEKIVPGGMGLGTAENGKKIFFWNALPGEIVEEFKILKNKSSYAEAVALKVLNESPDRVAPKDSHFLSTSPWQILNFDAENRLKSELVAESFREEKITIAPPEVLTDQKDYFYRNKMEYALFWDNETQKISLAFHARGSHRKIPIENSSLERPEIFARATEIVKELNENHEEARKYQSLLLRCDQTGKVSGGLYENGRPHPEFTPLSDEILNKTYSYSPNGFFQINLPVYELALREIKKHIQTEKVLDLYSGVGTIGLSVAHGRALTLVEVDKFAFKELEKNCENAAGFSSLTPVLSKSEEVTNFLEPDQTVILDPPRAGCDKKLLSAILDIKPERIIYLSCNPSTEARDVHILLDGYKIEDVKTFNFFPHTPHIENLVILSRK